MDIIPEACDDYVAYEDCYNPENDASEVIQDNNILERLIVGKIDDDNDIFFDDDDVESIGVKGDELEENEEDDNFYEGVKPEEASTDCDVLPIIQKVTDIQPHNITEVSANKKKFVFKCDLCDFSTGMRFALARHKAQHSNEAGKTTREEPCSTAATSNNNPIKEIKKQFFKCPIQDCDFRSTTRFLINKHRQTHRKKPQDSAKSVKCKYCFTVFALNKGLNQHILRSHKDKTEKCGLCHTQVANQFKSSHVCRKKKMTYSCMRELKGLKLQNAEKESECGICSYKSASMEKFLAHKASCNSSFVEHQKVNIRKMQFIKCSKCSYKGTKSSVTSHFRKTHYVEAKKMKCKHCSYSTYVKQCLQRHSIIHSTGKAVMKCPHCDYRSTNYALRLHINKKHSESLDDSKLNCLQCSYKSKSIRDFNRHQGVHFNKKPIIPCPDSMCDYKSTITALYSHLRRVHGYHPEKMNMALKSLNAYKRYKCQECSYETRQIKNHKKHQMLHHNGSLIRQCPHCDNKFTERALRFHLEKDHFLTTDIDKSNSILPLDDVENKQEGVEAAEEKLSVSLECSYCPYVAAHETAIMFHLTTVHREYNVHCKYCQKAIPKQAEQAHLFRCLKKGPKTEIASAEPKVPVEVQCKYCSHTCSRTNLKSHLLQHTSNKVPLVKCEQCDFVASIRLVNKHLRSAHSLASPSSSVSLSCKFCSYIAKSVGAIYSHTKLHTELKKPIYKCEFCSYVSTKFCLKRHIKTRHKQQEERFSEISPFEAKQLLDLENQVLVHEGGSNHSLREHNVEVPSEQLMKQCGNSGSKTKMVIDKKKLQEFIEKTDLKGDDCYRCRICSETTRFRYQIKAHMNVHKELFVGEAEPTSTSIEKFMGETSRTGSETEEIVQSSTNPAPMSNLIVSSNLVFICELCDFATQSKDALLKHKKNHSDKPSNSLPHANPTVKSDINALTKKTANSTKKGKSALTLESFSSTSIHLTCQKCNTAFPDVTSLRKHSCEIPAAKCPFCNYRASGKSALHKHIFTKHSLEEDDEDIEDDSQTRLFQCEMCDFQTDLESQLHNHRVLHININEMKVYKNKTYNVEIKKSSSGKYSSWRANDKAYFKQEKK